VNAVTQTPHLGWVLMLLMLKIMMTTTTTMMINLWFAVSGYP
jgi:hypothetical protein